MTFEDYLKDIHADDYHGTDDDMPDAFEDWVTNDLMQEELFEHADKYALIKFLDGKIEGLKAGKEIMMNDMEKEPEEPITSTDPTTVEEQMDDDSDIN